MKKTNTIVLTMVMLLSMGVFAEEKATEKKMAPSMMFQAPSVTVDTVKTLVQEDFKKFVGIIRSVNEVTIPVRVSGVLEKIDFKEGALVKKGDLLFEIEDDIYIANLQAAEAALKQIKAEYDYAKSEFDRFTKLKEKEISSQADYENAVRLYKSTEAQIAKAEAAVAIAKLDLSYTKIYSQLTGRISEKTFSVGNYVTPSAGSLANIVQIDPIRVNFSMVTADYLKYIKGQNLSEDTELVLEIGNGVEKKSGIKVDFIANQIDRDSATLMVHLICENSDEFLFPGGFLTVKLAKKYKEPLPVIPVIAIMTDKVGSYVYVVDDKNIATRRNITLGKQTGEKQIVTAGLKEGERVISEGVHKVILNMPVVPVMAQDSLK